MKNPFLYNHLSHKYDEYDTWSACFITFYDTVKKYVCDSFQVLTLMLIIQGH